MPVVWSQLHNQPMERFASLRHTLVRKAKARAHPRLVEFPQAAAPKAEGAREESRLAGILVLLLPLAALAWAAIGFFVYQLVT
jgi:hypothetical protein